MDEMERAHRNDYEYEKKLREARMALRAVVDEGRLPGGVAGDLEVAAIHLSKEMDHIVARWN
jgi:hypothetical protein